MEKIGNLQRIQRTALMRLGQFRKNTPGPVLEVISNVKPLNLFLKETAMKSAIRNRKFLKENWSGVCEKTIRRDKKIVTTRKESTLYQLKRDLTHMGIRWDDEFDAISKVKVFDQDFKIEIGDGMGSREPGTLTAWTDGSRFKDQAGAGIFIQVPNDEDVEVSIRLDNFCTVYQCEIFAIYSACQIILQKGYEEEEVTIMVDSQAAILSLSANTIESQMVLQTWNILQELASQYQVTIRWVRAHCGVYGNEIADRLAKQGTVGEKIPLYTFPKPKSYVNKVINDNINEQWNATWANSDKYVQTKKFIPRLKPKMSEAIMKLPKQEFSRAVRFLSNLNGLAKFEHRLNEEIVGPNCRLCSSEDDFYNYEETAIHIVFECSKLTLLRAECFGQYLMDEPYFWDVRGLSKFLRNKYVISLEEGEETGIQTWKELQPLQLGLNEFGDLVLSDERKGVG